MLLNQSYGNPFSEKLKAILVYILPEMDLEKRFYEKTFYWIEMIGGSQFSEIVFSKIWPLADRQAISTNAF